MKSSSQRWTKLGYEDAINMGKDRYAHMVFNTLKTRTSHKVHETRYDGGARKVIMLPGCLRLSQAALARELGMSRQTLLHTLRFLVMRGILTIHPDESGTTIKFNDFAYHAVKDDALSKQGCLRTEHYNRGSKDNYINNKTLVSGNRAGGFVLKGGGSYEATKRYLAELASIPKVNLSESILTQIRQIQHGG